MKTDGKSILADMSEPEGRGRKQLLNVRLHQWEEATLVSHALYAELDYDGDRPEIWWPMTKRKLVLLDPLRSFGAPIVKPGAVPTSILANSARAEKSLARTAALYDVPVRAVRDAVAFEKNYLAA
jgi:hypothetical protein